MLIRQYLYWYRYVSQVFNKYFYIFKWKLYNRRCYLTSPLLFGMSSFLTPPQMFVNSHKLTPCYRERRNTKKKEGAFSLSHNYIFWVVWVKTVVAVSNRIPCNELWTVETLFFLGGIFVDFILFYPYILYSTLLHMPPLRFHCGDGCWDRTRRTVATGALAVRRSNHLARSHPQFG
jgi:hypothetical protein